MSAACVTGGVPVFAEVAGVSKSKSRDNLDVYAVEGDAVWNTLMYCFPFGLEQCGVSLRRLLR